MLNATLEMRRACDNEIDVLIEIWKQKVHDLSKRGIKVWNMDQFTREKLRLKYGNPDYFVGVLGGDIFGGFILLDRDIHFWPDSIEGEAFYFHKFVIKSEYGGKGLSKAMLEWVKEYGKRQGKEYIRLDFNENRDYLKNLYYGNGFRYVGINAENGDDRIVLAECRIGES